MGRQHHEQRSQTSVRKDSTVKDKDKDKHKGTPRRDRKRGASRSPSLVSPRRKESDRDEPDHDMAAGSIQPASEPTLLNLDSKLDKVIQLQLNAQSRIADIEKVLAMHEVSLKELGPLNRSLVDLSQRVDAMDARFEQLDRKGDHSSATRLGAQQSSAPSEAIPRPAKLSVTRPSSVPPRGHATIRSPSIAASEGAMPLESNVVAHKRKCTMVVSGFPSSLSRDELTTWATKAKLGTPTAVYTKMRFSKVVFLLYSTPEEARSQIDTIRNMANKLMYEESRLYVDLDRGPADRQRGWVLRELRRHLCTSHPPDAIAIDYGPGVVYIKREIGFFIRDQQVHVGKAYLTNSNMAKIAESFTTKLCF